MEKNIQQTIIFKANEEETKALKTTMRILDEICHQSYCVNCPFKWGEDCYKNSIDEDLRNIIKGEFSITKKIDE